MIPLLIVSDDNKLVNSYLNKLKRDNIFFEITPSTKEYSIDDIKSLIKETKVFHPKTRIYFLANFHLSSIPAQNSFLKLLEEPPFNVQFVLSTNNKNNLLPTIISRVKIIKLRGKNERGNVDKFVVDETKIPLSQFKITDKESAKKILLDLIMFFRKKLDSDKKSPIIIKEILRLNSLLESNNLNPQLTIDQGLIFIWKRYTIK
jgi:DNA polymerase-3 subunit delta'